MLKEQHRFFRSVLIAADTVLIVAAGIAAYALRFHILAPVIPLKDAGPITYQTHAIPLEVAAPIILVAMLWAGLYRPRRDERFHLEAAMLSSSELRLQHSFQHVYYDCAVANIQNDQPVFLVKVGCRNPRY